MNINIREYMAADAKSASEIWNQVVEMMAWHFHRRKS